MCNRRFSLVILLSLVLGIPASGRIIQVPGDSATIRAGMNGAVAGDTVLVAPDTFPENIDFGGKSIVVASWFLTTADTSYISQTVIDGGGAGVGQSAASFVTGEDSLCRLVGLTIRNGWCSDSHGGGVTVTNGSGPRIEDCRIVENGGPASSAFGVGVHCTGSDPVFVRCFIRGNSIGDNGNYDHCGGGVYLALGATPTFNDCEISDNDIAAGYSRNYGGGVYSDGSSPTFESCLFSGNTATHAGGILANNSSNVTLRNCYFTSNYASGYAGAILSWYSSSVEIDSCLIYGNRAELNGGALCASMSGTIDATHTTITDNSASLGGGVYAESDGSPILTDCIVFYNWYNEVYPFYLPGISYCDVRGGYTGTGNLDVDPLFCDWVNKDYELADNSLCLTGGSGGGLIGYHGAGCSAIYPRTRRVPLEYMTIQEAILASYEGDTVLVAPDTFPENIDFWGRRVLLASNYLTSGDTSDISQTVIDGGGSLVGQSAVSFIRNEDTLSVMTGLTITNGWCSDTHGGGITVTNWSGPRIQDCRIVENGGHALWARGVGVYCTDADPVFERCLIKGNSIADNGNYDHMGGGVYLASGATPTFSECQIMDNRIDATVYWRNYGGGVYCDGSSPTFQTCLFSGNGADYGGGILATSSSDVTLRNCYFLNNYARSQGGGLYCGISVVTAVNDLFCYNSAGSEGGGVYLVNCAPSLTNVTMSQNSAVAGGAVCCHNSSPVLTNVILWADSASSGLEIFVHSGTPTVTYSDIEGGWSGAGNIDTDPFFDGTLSFFLSDSSGCIDAGDPNPMYNDIEDPMSPGYALWPSMGGLRNDMGAYGGPDVLPWILPTGIEEREIVSTEVPRHFQLHQNYPNPFKSTTDIHFALPKPSQVKIELYNALGQQVAVLLDEHRPAGSHVIRFDGRQFGSGVYFCRMTTSSFTSTAKMLLID